VSIDLDVRYRVRVFDGEAKVFGWASGDLAALLRARGIV